MLEFAITAARSSHAPNDQKAPACTTGKPPTISAALITPHFSIGCLHNAYVLEV